MEATTSPVLLPSGWLTLCGFPLHCMIRCALQGWSLYAPAGPGGVLYFLKPAEQPLASAGASTLQMFSQLILVSAQIFHGNNAVSDNTFVTSCFASCSARCSKASYMNSPESICAMFVSSFIAVASFFTNDSY